MLVVLALCQGASAAGAGASAAGTGVLALYIAPGGMDGTPVAVGGCSDAAAPCGSLAFVAGTGLPPNTSDVVVSLASGSYGPSSCNASFMPPRGVSIAIVGGGSGSTFISCGQAGETGAPGVRAITTTATVFALSGVSIAGGLAAASGDTKGGGVKVDWGQGQCGPCSANFSDVVLMGNAASGALAMGGGAAVVLAVCPNATTATVALDGVTASGNTVTGPPLGPASSLTMLGGGGVAVSTVSGLAPACALLTPSSAPSSLLVTIQGSSFVGNKCANNNTHGGGFLLVSAVQPSDD
jgi:hypothetical protein